MNRFILELVCRSLYLFIAIAPLSLYATTTNSSQPGLSPSPMQSSASKPKPQASAAPVKKEEAFVMPSYQSHRSDRDDSDTLYKNYWKGYEQYQPKR